MNYKYINVALETAQFIKLLDGSWFAEIPTMEGVWANCSTVQECKSELLEVVDEWIILKIKHGEPIPMFSPLTM